MHKRIDTLQIVRAVAAILVMLYHLTHFFETKYGYTFAFGLFKNGGYAVDYFFALSGFIIYLIHKKDIGEANKFTTYVTKRIIRVYPIYWVISFAVIPLYFLAPSFGSGYETDPSVIVKSLALFPQEHLPIIPVAWTLSHEVFFYLMFSIFILVPNKKISAIIASLWLLTSVIFFVFNADTHYLLQFMFSKYNLEFALGCLAAYLFMTHKLRYATVSLIAGIFLLLVGNYSLNNNAIIDPAWFLGPSAFLIVLAVIQFELPSNRLTGVATFLGDASYSIYLIHPEAIMFNTVFDKLGVLNKLGHPLYSVFLTIFVLTASCLFYVLIERPLLRQARVRVMKRRKAPTGVGT